MMNIVFNMETADPDDVLTLCLLAGHPQVNLVGITVVPGSKHQIGLIRHVLKELNLSIPIGSKTPDHPKSCVSDFHYRWLSRSLEQETAEPDGLGEDVLKSILDTNKDVKIVSGASLSCIGR